MTSSPAFTAAASKARCNAVVQLETAHAYGTPTATANSRSNAATSGPWVTHPERIGRRAASASFSSSHGRLMGMIDLGSSGSGILHLLDLLRRLAMLPPIDEPFQAVFQWHLRVESDA